MAIEEIIDKTKNFPYKNLAIFLILLKYLIDNYITYRQYKHLSENSKIPNELKDLGIDEKKYKETKIYSKEKLFFTIIETSFTEILEIFLIYFNYYPFLWEISRDFNPVFNISKNNEYIASLFFSLIEFLRATIIEIPFNYYKNFIIEEKYNFNTMTIKTFITDTIKTLLLKIIFLPIIIILLIKVINWGGKNFYIYAEIFTIIIIFIFLWIYPNFIAPLYNKFKELEEGEIKERIFKLAQRVNYPLKKLYEVDESTRSAHSNAYLYGIGNNKRIVLYDTLIKKLLPEEIEAVLGHEIGHWKKSHNIKTLIITFIHVFILFYVFGFFMNDERIFLSFGFENKSIFIGLYLYFVLYSPISYVTDILQLKFIRTFEFEADQFSKELGYSEQLISGLKKLFEKNLSDMDPDPLYSLVNNSHPTLIERVRALNEKKKSD